MKIYVEKISKNHGLQGLTSLIEVFSKIIKERVSAEMELVPEIDEEKIDGRKHRRYWQTSED